MRRRAAVPLVQEPGSDPPRGNPWDEPFERAPFVFIDAEMTGLDPAHDALVEVALVRMESGCDVREFSSLVAPSRPSSPAALAVHGLDALTLANAPCFDAIAGRVEALLRGAVPVAHGAVLDRAFLARALKEAGRDPSVVAFMIDTLTLARRAVFAHSYALGPLCESLGLGPYRWHRALDDARAVADLFHRLAPEFSPPTPRDLWEVRVGQRESVRVRASIASRLADLAQEGARGRLVVRRARHTAQSITGTIERWAPPHVYIRRDEARDGLTVVRADRILRIESSSCEV